MTDILTELANKYYSDKGTVYDAHRFAKVYHDYFESKRDDVKSVFEIGVWGGGSLRMWRDYFPNADIYGIDNNPRYLFLEERISTCLVDQSNRDKLKRFADEYGPFDFIIDDGGHVFSSQQISWGCLFPYLKPGGLYIIEDLQHADETRILLKGFKESSYKTLASPHILYTEAYFIKAHIESIDIVYTRLEDKTINHITSLIRRK